MNARLLAFVVFAGVTGLVGAVSFLVIRGGAGGRTSERLDVLMGRGGRSKDSSTDLMIKQALQEVGRSNILERLTPEFFRVSKMFEQADVQMKPSVLFGIALGFAFVGGLISTLMVNIFVGPVGGGLLFTLPFIWLWWKRASRLKKFASQLPEAMELVARALRAGHSLAAGLQVVSSESPQPIAKEFGRVYEEQNLGVSLEDASHHMCTACRTWTCGSS